jgi:hypothetical protein
MCRSNVNKQNQTTKYFEPQLKNAGGGGDKPDCTRSPFIVGVPDELPRVSKTDNFSDAFSLSPEQSTLL